MDKVLTHEEQRFIEVLRQRVGEAVTEVEPRGMPGAPAEATMRVAGDHDLAKSNWLDGYTKASDQIIKGRAKDRTWVSIHRDCGFQEVRRGHESGR